MVAEDRISPLCSGPGNFPFLKTLSCRGSEDGGHGAASGTDHRIGPNPRDPFNS